MSSRDRFLGTFSGWVAMNPDLSVTAKAAYLALACHADGTGYCYPSVTVISNAIGKSRSTTITALNELERHGVLAREPRWVDGRQTSNAYVLKDVRTIRSGRTPGSGVPEGGGSGVPEGGGSGVPDTEHRPV